MRLQCHSHLLTNAINDTTDDTEHAGTEGTEEAVLRHSTLSRAEEDQGDESHWQSMLDRARARAHGLQEHDLLWEIGCKVSMANFLLFF